MLVYNTPFNGASGEPGAGDTSADFVYGQGGAFTTMNCNLDGASATTLCNPAAVTLDGAGNIYIADAGNNRVLEFAKAGNPPVASDAIANRSYGQGAVSDFSDTQCADGVGPDPAPSNHGMCNPGGVALDMAGNLFIADSGNSRVMEIDAPLEGTQTATRVFGQAGNFTASGCNQGTSSAPGASTLCAPAGLMLDVIGNLWVADVNNDRVLEYDAPFGSDTAAAMVIGQGDGGNFTTSGCNRGIAPGDLKGLGADSLCLPGSGGGRFEYRPLRGGHGQQSVVGLRRDSRDALGDSDADRKRDRHTFADHDGDDDRDRNRNRDADCVGDGNRDVHAICHADTDSGTGRQTAAEFAVD